MGDWTYYITFMKMRYIAQRVKAAEEIHKSKALKELIQRELDESKHAEQIKRYLIKDEQRFFNSLVIGVYKGAPEWSELDLEGSPTTEVPSDMEGVFGILTLRGDERLFAIDGQHRAVAIRMAVAEKPSLGNEEVSAVFVGHKETEAGRQRTRRLFTRLNRFAKPVRKEEIIALDEDDIVAILTRDFVEDDPRFQEKVSIRKTKSLPPTDKQSFTTISALYDCLDVFLELGQTSWNDFKRVRPSQEEIRKLNAKASSLWEALAEAFPPVAESFDGTAEDAIAGNYRSSTGGHLLFRPIGLQLAIETMCELMANGGTLSGSMARLAKVPMEVEKEPWVGLLWDRVNQRMITQVENQRAAAKLLYHAAGGDLSDINVEPRELRKELAGLLNRKQSDVKLPVYAS